MVNSETEVNRQETIHAGLLQAAGQFRSISGHQWSRTESGKPWQRGGSSFNVRVVVLVAVHSGLLLVIGFFRRE